MKAMVLNRPAPAEMSPLQLIDLPCPEPGKHEVLVRVRACGICRTDLHTIEGEITPPAYPIIPGHQIIGRVEKSGSGAKRFLDGERVGIAWLHSTDGTCRFCVSGRENLCDHPEFTGFTRNGGYAEFVTVPEDFAYYIPEAFDDIEAAPLLCAGIIGYRSLKRSNVQPGQKLGIYGFGAAAHVCVQIARFWGCEVYVFTRGEPHRRLARELGAKWTGPSQEITDKLDSAIIFAPAGELVPGALKNLKKGGVLALGGIYMTETPPLHYLEDLYYEREVRSVTANTRRDGVELLEIAARIPVRTQTQIFPLEQANEALIALKQGKINGAGVLIIK